MVITKKTWDRSHRHSLLNGNFNLNITTSVFPTLVGSPFRTSHLAFPSSFICTSSPSTPSSLFAHMSFSSLLHSTRLPFLKSQSFRAPQRLVPSPLSTLSHIPSSFTSISLVQALSSSKPLLSLLSSPLVAMLLESDSTPTTISHNPYWDTQSSTMEFQTPTGSASANHSASFTLIIFSFQQSRPRKV